MPYLLTDEQKMMQDMVRKLAQNEIAPRAAEIDRTHEFPRENIRKMAELGLMGVPIRIWRCGCDFYPTLLLGKFQSLRYYRYSGGTYFRRTLPILYFGTEEQKRKYPQVDLRGNGSGLLHDGSNAVPTPSNQTTPGWKGSLSSTATKLYYQWR